jgi:hypothetical protein
MRGAATDSAHACQVIGVAQRDMRVLMPEGLSACASLKLAEYGLPWAH